MNYFIAFWKFIFPLFSFKSVTDTAACILPIYFHGILIIYCLMSSTEIMKFHSKHPELIFFSSFASKPHKALESSIRTFRSYDTK